jgi:hypothetical protein
LSGTTPVEISIIAVTKNKNPGIKNVSIDFILDTLHLNGNPAVQIILEFRRESHCKD